MAMTENMCKNPVLLWVCCVKHQLIFYNEVTKYLPKNRPLLKILVLNSSLQYMSDLLNWIREDLTQDSFESNVLDTINEKYKPIRIILRQQEVDRWVYKDCCRKCELLKNIIIYIKGIMNQHEIITTTLKLTKEMQGKMKKLTKQSN